MSDKELDAKTNKDNCFNKIKNFIKSKLHIADKYNKEETFYSLLPKDDVDEDNIYYDKFRTSIDNNCKLIAFSGRYGVGKTSIINSILNKYRKSNIRITLGDYKNKEITINENNQIKKEDIELKILQQIVYTEKPSNLPLSRFKRIANISNLRVINYLIVLVIFLLCLMPFLFDYYMYIYEKVKEATYLSGSNWRYLLRGIYIVGIVILLYLFIKVIIRTINSVTIKNKNIEIKFSKSDSNESIFNKYMDEIVYFFKTTKNKILVIEDIDRYENVSLEIFKELKELNYLLNANKEINRNGGVIFVYAIRDDLFKDKNDRVKFFDYIIPVVSKFSTKNSKEYLIELYDKLKADEKYSKIKIDNAVFSTVSHYIQDRRLLNNIFTEFKVYVDVLDDNQEINYTQLFALICYKNINPEDFEKVNKFEGDLYNIFENKDLLVKYVNSKLINEIRKEEEIEDKHKEYEIITEKRLKKEFWVDLMYNYSFRSDYIANIMIKTPEKNYYYKEFIEEQLVNISSQHNWRIGSLNSSDYTIDSEKVKQLYDNVKKCCFDYEEHNKKIAILQQKIADNNEATLSNILCSPDFNINQFKEENKDEKIEEIYNNSFLITLIKNGFIKENYQNDISYFKSGDLTQDEYSFITKVTLGEKTDPNTKLHNSEKIINDELNAEYLKKEGVLNYSFCDFILKRRPDIKSDNFYSQFTILSENKISFLNGFYKYNVTSFINLFDKIKSDEIIKGLLNDNNICKGDIFKTIIENISLDKVINENTIEDIKHELMNELFINEIELNDISKDNLLLIKPHFENYYNIKDKFIEFFYENDNYIINKSFYDKLIDVKRIDIDYKKENLIEALLNFDCLSNFKEKLLRNDEFLNIYNTFDKYSSNEESIIKLLNDENFDIKWLADICKNEVYRINNIQNVKNKEMWNVLIDENFIEPSMENLINYYNYTKCIDNRVINIIESLDFKFKSYENETLKTIEEELIYYNDISFLNLEDIANGYYYIIDKFIDGKNINTDLVLYLIENNKIALNELTFDYLEDNYNELLVKLIDKNENDFYELVNKLNINIELIENILEIGNSFTVKKYIINNSSIDVISNININTLERFISKLVDKNECLNEVINQKVFELLNDERFKSEYFIVSCKKDLSNLKYLRKINSNYSKIRDGNSTIFSIEFEEYRKKLFEYLKDINFINNCEVNKSKIKISYSKSSYENI